MDDDRLSAAVARKVAQARLDRAGPAAPPVSRDVVREYRRAAARWAAGMAARPLSALVLDLDGTLVDPGSGTAQPAVREALGRLLDRGMLLAVATGRASAAFGVLRATVARRHWAGVVVGFAHGYRICSLADTPPPLGPPSGELAEYVARLRRAGLPPGFQIRANEAQVTVFATSPAASASLPALAPLLTAVALDAPALDLRLVSSGASFDVLASTTGKSVVLRAAEDRAGGQALVAGDQGQPGGNDFDLLAATASSVSVGRCSSDPGRCWPVAPVGRSGPPALADVLQRLRPEPHGWILDLGPSPDGTLRRPAVVA